MLHILDRNKAIGSYRLLLMIDDTFGREFLLSDIKCIKMMNEDEFGLSYRTNPKLRFSHSSWDLVAKTLNQHSLVLKVLYLLDLS